MEQFLDFILGIPWWQWLLGTAAAAGLYYLAIGVLAQRVRDVHEEREEEDERERQGEEDDEKLRDGQRHDAARREYLKQIPSGPVAPASLPPARVTVRGRSHRIPLDDELTFGASRSVTVPIVHRGVSREHAKIRPEARGYVLYDLMSLHGTFVGATRVHSKVLADGDVIRIGPEEIKFQLGAPSEGE